MRKVMHARAMEKPEGKPEGWDSHSSSFWGLDHFGAKHKVWLLVWANPLK